MSQYSKTTKQQLNAYNRTFSTTLNSGYKNQDFYIMKYNNELKLDVVE